MGCIRANSTSADKCVQPFVFISPDGWAAHSEWQRVAPLNDCLPKSVEKIAYGRSAVPLSSSSTSTAAAPHGIDCYIQQRKPVLSLAAAAASGKELRLLNSSIHLFIAIDPFNSRCPGPACLPKQQMD